MTYTVVCDVDGVVADIMPAWLQRYNEDYGDNLTREQVTDWDIAKFVKPECGDKIFDFLADPRLYDTMQPVRDALKGLKALRNLTSKLYFATACTYGMTDAKARWMERHDVCGRGAFHGLPNQLVVLRHKAQLRGHVLIDDGIHNVQEWIATGRPAILFKQDHNHNHSISGALFRYAENWGEVVWLIETLSTWALHKSLQAR